MLTKIMRKAFKSSWRRQNAVLTSACSACDGRRSIEIDNPTDPYQGPISIPCPNCTDRQQHLDIVEQYELELSGGASKRRY